MFLVDEAGVCGERRWSVDGVDGPIPGRGGVMMVGIRGRECDEDIPLVGNDLVGVEDEVDADVDRGVFIISSNPKGTKTTRYE